MSSTKMDLLHPRIREEAVRWFVAFCEESVDSDGRRDFNAWLRSSPEHVRAYLRISALWEDAGDLKKHARQGIDQIVQGALAEFNVVPFTDAGFAERPRTRAGGVWTRRALLRACFVTIACVSAIGLIWALFYHEPVYATAVGERRVLTLPDGSTVELNARSRVKIRYSETRRDVDLLAGQALFRVARSPTRPFMVHSDTTHVRAVGTAFDVYRRRRSTIVTVVTGRVIVSDSSSAAVGSARAGIIQPAEPAAVSVSAGERVVASAHVLERAQRADATGAIAWTEGKLVFNAVPLPDVLEEFNRYLPRPIVAQDPRVLEIHISGVFSVTESQYFIEFLQQRFGTRAYETESEIRLVRQ
jgi:transmembrane sensor